ncbi:hypothetical protein CNMCM6936_004828 [Aspergillus lentulus]|uniref:Zn(2)-C6 fungal-type domain-containing protein n=1 Tax=Aspergillus lentulus TaxID=293939 RepID=A0AAN5YSI7_ASPLE|nr:hypothetical protein CNMCM6069_009200 [Aspergillus lentulus]KAF4167564.1 hypothetical protein CNMCM6936_004828 [Aspergillus lentulus]KAF4179776.1 hypothetical protein CNMCM8060_002499 [Aspergillus lentulus]KAF4185561.1 hypothetical protein CNMCM7927_006505 [Aspergillus lentulus]KAF4194957.1 hypothetical protein CNMCM8694_006970 [Aspergillus lentulus]
MSDRCKPLTYIQRKELRRPLTPFPFHRTLGCLTCKAKRLKCDESKPTCLQCKKRNVECGGYKKDFKWRPFEETNVVSRISSIQARKSDPATSGKERRASRSVQAGKDRQPWPVSARSSTPTASSLESNDVAPIHTIQSGNSPSTDSPLASAQENLASRNGGIARFLDFSKAEDELFAPFFADSSPLEQSPRLSDIVPSALDIHTSPIRRPLGLASQNTTLRSGNLSFAALLGEDNDKIEEIARQSDEYIDPWLVGFSDGGASSETSNTPAMLTKEPKFDIASPEMLALQFDRFTCGILSVKDGVNENPWRTLIWPLAAETPALYHAIFSMTAFHSSKDNPGLRMHGVDHMRRSITYMVQDIQNMRADAALATSLALAFADTWDQHTRNCIQHVRGAKALVLQVLRSKVRDANDIERIRFLYNTWLYMDAIARLTSRDDEGDQDMNVSIFQLPRDAVHEIDPLMGCATTLFPLINQVARLIQRVRKTESNSISLVSQAIELKRLIEQWEPPEWFVPPEDPTSEVQHSIQTAHAYRWATLLYLHQAVPEMPSEPASDLAKRVLILLATVPSGSRTTIVQMFPLIAAGCEAEPGEDRQWVLSRWRAIQSRLMIGSIDRCIEVVQEVWSRRDIVEAEKQRRKERVLNSSNFQSKGGPGLTSQETKERFISSFTISSDSAVSSRPPFVGARRSSAVSPLENIEFEKTVRGKLHWVSVMQEWGWEGESLSLSV